MSSPKGKTSAEQSIIDGVMAQRAEIETPCDPADFRAFLRIATNPANHFAVSLGGGCIPGLASNTALVGILEELDLRARVKEVWGTSAGGVVASGWASGTSASELLGAIASLDYPGAVDVVWSQLLTRDLVGLLFRKQMPDGFIKGAHFRRVVDRHLKAHTFEKCEIPLRIICASDDGYARKIILREGCIADAVMGSMCLPGIFLPTENERGERLGYQDGGVVEKTPLLSVIQEHQRSGRAEQLFVLATHHNARFAPPEGFAERLVHAIDIADESSWEYQLSRAREAAGAKFAILNPKMEHGGVFDFSFTHFNYLWSRRAFKQQLSNSGLGLRLDHS